MRRLTSGGWNNWNTLLHSGNVETYALPIGGGTISGNITANAFYASSDIRLKKITKHNYNVSELKSISYQWKDERDKKIHVGYSAQEVEKVLPDAVSKNEEGFLSVDYIQVLVAKIAMLEAKQLAQEKEIELLKSYN